MDVTSTVDSCKCAVQCCVPCCVLMNHVFRGEYTTQEHYHEKLGMSYDEITQRLSFHSTQLLGTRRVNA